MFLIELFVSTFEMLIYALILYSMSGLSGGLISEKFLYFWVRFLQLSGGVWFFGHDLIFLLVVASLLITIRLVRVADRQHWWGLRW